jgi:hypothetical protein
LANRHLANRHLVNRHLAETMPRLSVDWGLSSKHFIFFATFKWAN